jgi:hypothetical protein
MSSLRATAKSHGAGSSTLAARHQCRFAREAEAVVALVLHGKQQSPRATASLIRKRSRLQVLDRLLLKALHSVGVLAC